MPGTVSRLADYLERQPFAGSLPEPDAIGGANLDGRPPEVAIFLKCREGQVADAGYLASGCGYLRACCSALLELAVGQTPGACHQITEAQLGEQLGGLPESRQYCAGLAVLALRNALNRLAHTDQEAAA